MTGQKIIENRNLCVIAVAVASVIYNSVLAIINAHVTPLGFSHVAAAEIMILFVGFMFIAYKGLGREDGGVVLLALFTALLSFYISLINQIAFIDYLRNILIIFCFATLGSWSNRATIHSAFMLSLALVMAVLLCEIFALTLYADLFEPGYYFETTRGLKPPEWDRTGLFGNALGFEGRLSFGLIGHRASSLFLEQVSLSNFAGVMMMYTLYFWDDMTRRKRLLLVACIALILLTTASRTMLTFSAVCLLGYFVFPLLPKLLSLLTMPLILLAGTMLYVLNPDAKGDNLNGRIVLTMRHVFDMDIYGFLGFYAQQAALFAANPDPTWVAPPGQSLHRCATELDLGPDAAYGWLAANAGRFGFVQRYSWEAWHYGFVAGPAPCSDAGNSIGTGGGDRSASLSQALPSVTPGWVRPLVLRAAMKWNVSAALLAAQLFAESSFDPNAGNGIAYGIAAFTPAAAAEYGLEDPFDPAAAIMAPFALGVLAHEWRRAAGRYRALSAVLLLAPPTPMLFMGEEWGATTPWQFFTSHPEPELGEATAKGRVAEFEKMGWDESVVPDPQDPETFHRSKLDWSELQGEDHALLLGLYRELARLRRARPELTDPSRTGLSARALDTAGGRVYELHRGDLVVVVNLSDAAAAVPVASGSGVLLATVEGLTLTEMNENEVCCGFGGTFCIKYPDISNRMVTEKVANIRASGAGTLLAGDLGCLMNMAGKLKRQGSDVRVWHVAEVLAGMTDGAPIADAAPSR